MFAKVFLSALLMLGLSGTAMAAEREDLAIFHDVSKQVQRYVYFTMFDTVSADVDNGIVVLTGKVTMPYKATDIARQVAKVDGVRQVHNRIETLPVSQFDDNLRLSIARALYSHPALHQYGLGVNPSIHVIVERGRVTLDGVVNNDSDRSIAHQITRSFGAFETKNELKTSAEMKVELEKL